MTTISVKLSECDFKLCRVGSLFNMAFILALSIQNLLPSISGNHTGNISFL